MGAPKYTRPPVNIEELTRFFLVYLNHIYCAKTHLVERLPELRDQVQFLDLKSAIRETLIDLKKQVFRIEQIFELLSVFPTISKCEPQIGFIEDCYDAIHRQRFSSKMRDLSILFYLSQLQNIELSSFKILQITAQDMPVKNLQRLLNENDRKSKGERKLLVTVSSSYAKNK